MLSGVVVEETIRRHVTHIGYVTYVAFLAIVALWVSRFDVPAAAWPSLVGLLAIITGSGPIGPEFSSGTLQLILVKPIRRVTYLLSRVAGVVGVIWIAAIVAFLVEVIGRMLRGSVPFASMATTLLHTAAMAVLTVALLTLFGSLTRAYLNAAIYVVLSIALGALPPMLANRYPDVARALMFVEQNLFPSPPPALSGKWLLLVFSNALVALVLACLAFRRREVPYGAD